MMNWLPVLAAFAVVGGMLSFLAYCSQAFDAEDKKVRARGPAA